MKYEIERKDRRFGPFSGTQLKALAAKGKLRRDDVIIACGSGRKSRARDVPGLFPDPAESVSHLAVATVTSNSDEDIDHGDATDSEGDDQPTSRSPLMRWAMISSLVFIGVGIFAHGMGYYSYKKVIWNHEKAKEQLRSKRRTPNHYFDPISGQRVNATPVFSTRAIHWDVIERNFQPRLEKAQQTLGAFRSLGNNSFLVGLLCSLAWGVLRLRPDNVNTDP